MSTFAKRKKLIEPYGIKTQYRLSQSPARYIIVPYGIETSTEPIIQIKDYGINCNLSKRESGVFVPLSLCFF